MKKIFHQKILILVVFAIISQQCMLSYATNYNHKETHIYSSQKIGLVIINKIEKPILGLQEQIKRLQIQYNHPSNAIQFLGVNNGKGQRLLRNNLIQITIYKEITYSRWYNFFSLFSLFIIPGYSRNYYVIQTSFFDRNGVEHKIPLTLEKTPYQTNWFGWVFLPVYWLSDLRSHFYHRIRYEVDKITSNPQYMQAPEDSQLDMI